MWKPSKPAIDRLIEKKDVQGLIGALDDKDSSIVAAAANALGDLGDQRAVNPLKGKAVLGNLAAISALGRIGGPQAVRVLIRLTEREDFPYHVLAGVIQALGATGDPQIVSHVKGFLTHGDDWILGQTLAVLRKFLSEKEVAHLIREQRDLKPRPEGARGGVLCCEGCGKNFTHQQAQVESITSEDGSPTRYLFLCPECGSKLLDKEGNPYGENEEHPPANEE